MIAYCLVGDTLLDGSAIPADGEKLVFDTIFAGMPVSWQKGIHASVEPFDAIHYATGTTLCQLELGGTVATEATIIKRIDAKSLIREFARKQALSVAHLWDMPEVVRQYLETGDESLREQSHDIADAARLDADTDVIEAAADAARFASIDADPDYAPADIVVRTMAAADAASFAADKTEEEGAFFTAAMKEFNEVMYAAFN
jgi:hypothetical protein